MENKRVLLHTQTQVQTQDSRVKVYLLAFEKVYLLAFKMKFIKYMFLKDIHSETTS